MSFPASLLRKPPALRRPVRKTRVSADDLNLPLFAVPGEGVARTVSSMPRVFQHSVDQIVGRRTMELRELARSRANPRSRMNLPALPAAGNQRCWD